MSELQPRDTDDENEEDEADAPGKMGFLDHVEELRWTLIKPLAVFVIAFVLTIVFIKDVKDVLLYPLHQTNSTMEGQVAADPSVDGETVDQNPEFDGLATRNPTGVFAAMMHIGLIVGVGVSSPFVIFYLGKFLAPALTWKEKKILIPGSFGVLFLFLLGSSFSFFLLIPKAIEVTMVFNRMMDFQMIWTPDSYFGFVTWIVLGMGVAFQFPLVAIILVYLDMVTVAWLRSIRRIAYLVFVIVSALLTPPDPVTQLMMACPMIVLYEVSLVIASFMMKRKIAKERESELED